MPCDARYHIHTGTVTEAQLGRRETAVAPAVRTPSAVNAAVFWGQKSSNVWKTRLKVKLYTCMYAQSFLR